MVRWNEMKSACIQYDARYVSSVEVYARIMG